jgi:hypothetical protein
MYFVATSPTFLRNFLAKTLVSSFFDNIIKTLFHALMENEDIDKHNIIIIIINLIISCRL